MIIRARERKEEKPICSSRLLRSCFTLSRAYESCFACRISNLIDRCFGLILGDPGADSGGEGKSKRLEKYGTKKSKNGEKSPWGQCLTRPVPNGRRQSGF